MKHITTLSLLLAMPACSALGGGAGEVNDTQIGDDEVGGEEGDQWTDPDPIDPALGRGKIDYCPARGDYWLNQGEPEYPWEYTQELVDRWTLHERAAPLETVGYGEDAPAPSPLQVVSMRTPGDDLNVDFDPLDDDHSGLWGAYAIALPQSIVEPSPGEGQHFPVYHNLATATIGNPVDSGRFNSQFEFCCFADPTPIERTEAAGLVLSPAWSQWDGGWDCAMHAVLKGANADVLGYPSLLNETLRMKQIQTFTACASGHGEYSGTEHVASAMALIELPNRKTIPAILNYEWIADWVEIDWKAVGLVDAVGALLGAILEQAITALYYPPEEYPQPRYGLGGGCTYGAEIRYIQDGNQEGWVADLVCPNAYYPAMGDVVGYLDGENGDKVSGHCKVDGASWADPPSPGAIIGDDAPGGVRAYGVDFEAFAGRMDAVGTKAVGTIDAETAALFSGVINPDDGGELIREGDTLQWWRAPEGEEGLSVGESFRRIAGWELDRLMLETGWEESRARDWVTHHGPAPISELLEHDGEGVTVSEEFGAVRANELRPQVWSLRVESHGTVRPIYISAY